MARRNGRANGKANGKGNGTSARTSMHPAVVEMQATIEKLGKQLSFDDLLAKQVAKLRFEQQRNLAVQEAFRELDLDLFDPRSEESKLDDT
jgi:hypothetical protein